MPTAAPALQRAASLRIGPSHLSSIPAGSGLPPGSGATQSALHWHPGRCRVVEILARKILTITRLRRCPCYSCRIRCCHVRPSAALPSAAPARQPTPWPRPRPRSRSRPRGRYGNGPRRSRPRSPLNAAAAGYVIRVMESPVREWRQAVPVRSPALAGACPRRASRAGPPVLAAVIRADAPGTQGSR